MNEYDVRAAFERIELELIASMRRNLGRHLAEEQAEGFDWSMWQAEQLKSLRSYQRNNRKIFKDDFADINREIKKFLHRNANNSALNTERDILNHVFGNATSVPTSDFFQARSDKLEALIRAVNKDMQKAEHAMLRKANDQYRKVIFNAQIYANSGAGTLKQSIDMATKDYLRAGLNCITYKNGRTINIASYAEMAVRTANRRAVLTADGEMRRRHGWHTVKVSAYGGCSETCQPWQGRVYVDDVYSGGTAAEAQALKLPLLSEAIAGGLFHPNCRHRLTTWFPGMDDSTAIKGPENPPALKEHNKNRRMIQRHKRIAAGALDPQTVATAKHQQGKWAMADEQLIANNPDLLEYKDGLDIPSFTNKKIVNSNNHDAKTVEEYFSLMDVITDDVDLIAYIKRDIAKMPIRDLEILRKHKLIVGNSRDANSHYKSSNKFLNRLLKRTDLAEISYKPGKAPGSFAHEFAHFVAAKTHLYQDDKFLDVIANSVRGADLDCTEINGTKYVRVLSDKFVEPYQGRTYLTYEDFEKKGTIDLSDLTEYVSVGYKTYIVDPQGLYTRDKTLYDYFESEGLYHDK